MQKDDYVFEVGEEGQQGLQILDYAFNPTTQTFVTSAGIKPGMRVLEVGCGLGLMTCWLAVAVGPKGHVDAIDIFEPQVKATAKLANSKGYNHVNAFVHSVYELDTLEHHYDLILCRFVLIHLSDPIAALVQMQGQLQAGGILACEEGLVSQAFTYPGNSAWGTERFSELSSDDSLAEHGRDGNYGMRLYHDMQQLGFSHLTAKLVQPVLTTKQEKSLLLIGLDENKDSMPADEYQSKREAMVAMADDPARLIAFYQSCQVFGTN